MLVETSAPGKIILLGEHSVVYKRPAICGVVDSLRIHCSLTTSDCTLCSITSKDEKGIVEVMTIDRSALQSRIQNKRSLSNCSFKQLQSLYGDIINCEKECSRIAFSVAIIVLFYYCEYSFQFGSIMGFHIVVENQGIPTEKGLGGSAALCTSIAAAFLSIRNEGESDVPTHSSCLNEINAWAYMGEKVFHGTPSGIDNTVSCFGGIVRFCKAMDNSFQIDPIESDSLAVLLIDSMQPKNTGMMLERVKELNEKLPECIHYVMEAMKEVVNSVIRIKNDQILLKEDMLEDAIRLNQGLLYSLGVSSNNIETICSICREYGYAAKLTGGGGGGCVIAYSTSSSKENDLMQALSSRGYSNRKVTIGGKGLWIKKC